MTKIIRPALLSIVLVASACGGGKSNGSGAAGTTGSGGRGGTGAAGTVGSGGTIGTAGTGASGTTGTAGGGGTTGTAGSGAAATTGTAGSGASGTTGTAGNGGGAGTTGGGTTTTNIKAATGGTIRLPVDARDPGRRARRRHGHHGRGQRRHRVAGRVDARLQRLRPRSERDHVHQAREAHHQRRRHQARDQEPRRLLPLHGRVGGAVGLGGGGGRQGRREHDPLHAVRCGRQRRRHVHRDGQDPLSVLLQDDFREGCGRPARLRDQGMRLHRRLAVRKRLCRQRLRGAGGHHGLPDLSQRRGSANPQSTCITQGQQACATDPDCMRYTSCQLSCGSAPPVDAGATDAATDAPPACTVPFTNNAPIYMNTSVAATLPAPTGGTIVPGTYWLTEDRTYTGPGGATGSTAASDQRDVPNHGNGMERCHHGGQQQPRHQDDVHALENMILPTRVCPAGAIPSRR